MSKKQEKKQDAVTKAWHYDVLLAPVVTEKSTMASEHGKVVFRVRREATKLQVKSAVETLFGVNVIGVNTILTKGKTKVFRGRQGERSDCKKAIVTLKDGQSIDYAAGV